MMISISKTVAVNPKHVMFVGETKELNDEGKREVRVAVFLVGCPSGLASDFSLAETLKLLNGDCNDQEN